ncbi:uncharacterized protein LOC142340531 isoform X2 [Convolutriloba macropyga]
MQFERESVNRYVITEIQQLPLATRTKVTDCQQIPFEHSSISRDSSSTVTKTSLQTITSASVLLSLRKEFLELQHWQTILTILQSSSSPNSDGSSVNDLSKLYILTSTDSWFLRSNVNNELVGHVGMTSESGGNRGMVSGQQLLNRHDTKLLKTAYLDAVAECLDRPVSIFMLQHVGPLLNSFEMVQGLQPRHLDSFLSRSSLDLPVISMVTRSNHFQNDDTGLCHLIAHKLESQFSRSRDLWSRLQPLYDRHSQNKLGSLVNCVSRGFAKQLIVDVKNYDYSMSTLETVFKFMDSRIPDALASPILSNFLWMKRYSYDFYLQNVARDPIIGHLSPSMFMYELKVVSYKHLEQHLVSSVMASEQVCPIVRDMLFIKLHSDHPRMDVRSIMGNRKPDTDQIAPYLPILGTRVLNLKDTIFWEKLADVLINNQNHKLQPMQDFDLSRLIFERIGNSLAKQKSLEPRQLMPIAKGIPHQFYQSGIVNDVELENFLRENSENIRYLPDPTLHTLLQRGPVDRENVESFTTQQHCYKFSVLSNLWFSEYQQYLDGEHSQLFYDKIEQSLIQRCETSDSNLGALNYAARLRGFMQANPDFKISARSVKLLDKSLAGILISDIVNLSPFDSLDVINLITSNSDVHKTNPQLSRTLADKAMDSTVLLSSAQFNLKGNLTWKTIPQMYLSYFNSFMLRELPLTFFQGTAENDDEKKRCLDIINKIGYSEDLKSNFSPFKALNFTNFYLNCLNESRLNSEHLVAVGSLVCELTPQILRTLDPESLSQYGYLFHDCCLSVHQSSALYKVATKAGLSYEDAYFSFGAAWPMIYSGLSELEKIASFLYSGQQRRIYYEKIAQLLSRATSMIYEPGSYCQRKLDPYEMKIYENSIQAIFGATFDKLRTIAWYKPYIQYAHDEKFDKSPSCSMMKTFGESLRFVTLDQLNDISDYDFQNCIKHISQLEFLQQFQMEHFTSKAESLKLGGYFVRELGYLVSYNDTYENDISLLSMINFTDYDELALHSHLNTFSLKQLETGLRLFQDQNRIPNLKDITALEISALGNFFCAADFNSLFAESGLSTETINLSKRSFSKLSLCGHENMKILKTRLQDLEMIPKSTEQMTEFDIADLGYILSGFTAVELNQISTDRPFVLQYVSVPFFITLPVEELTQLECNFWKSIQPKLLQSIPDEKLSQISEEEQICIVENINSGIVPLKHLDQIRGVYDTDFNDKMDQWYNGFDMSTEQSIKDSSNVIDASSNQSLDPSNGNSENSQLRLTYIFINSCPLLNISKVLFVLSFTMLQFVL